MNMTEGEMIQEMADVYEAQPDPEGFFTSTEWGVMLSLATRATRKRLLAAKGAGRLEVATVRRENLSDVMVNVKAYRIVPEE
jgi:hypothetical protein